MKTQRTIEKVDENFRVPGTIDYQDIAFYDVRKKPFSVYGLYNYKTQCTFQRMPAHIASTVSEGVASLYQNTAGGRVRFSTDSDVIAIRALMPQICQLPHMPLTGTAGFDLYVDNPSNGISRYYRTFVPSDIKDGYESAVHFPSKQLRSITINFPSYSSVKTLLIGVRNQSVLGAGMSYRNDKPVVYYGSSITQGACASRLGNSYQNIISRRLGLDYLNFGFSGSAKGESAMANYLASLPMSAFVSDYDHNAESPEKLEETHLKLYLTIRKKHPTVPYIIISKYDFDGNYTENILRRDVIYNTYRYARAHGDHNVYYIDGASVFRGPYEDMCTVDSCHPNDLGFALLADVIGAELMRAFTQASFA